MEEKDNKLVTIIFIVVIVLIIIFFILNFLNIKKTNNSYEILQKYKPNRNEIIEIVRNKLPVVMLGVVEDWFIYDKNDVIDQSKLTEEVLNENTKLLNNVLTINKRYEINLVQDKKNLKNSKLIRENKVRHFLCLLTGNISVYLFNPEQKIEYFINNNGQQESKYSFWTKEKEHLKETKYMEINLGTEQILFIPYGWWYCYQVKDTSIMLDINSDTVFTLPIKKLL
jgi:hypothetical protein